MSLIVSELLVSHEESRDTWSLEYREHDEGEYHWFVLFCIWLVLKLLQQDSLNIFIYFRHFSIFVYANGYHLCFSCDITLSLGFEISFFLVLNLHPVMMMGWWVETPLFFVFNLPSFIVSDGKQGNGNVDGCGRRMCLENSLLVLYQSDQSISCLLAILEQHILCTPSGINSSFVLTAVEGEESH